MPNVVGTAIVVLRVLSSQLSNDISRAVKDSVDKAGPNLDRAGNNIGRRMGSSISGGLRDSDSELTNAGRRAGSRIGDGVHDEVNRRQRSRLTGLFGNLGDGMGHDLVKHFNLGIGAARMGAGIISVLATAGPSLISGAAAIGTAMAAEIVVAMAAIGPGLSGAVGVGLAGLSSLVLSAGLLYAAFKLSGDTLLEVKKSFIEVGKLIGTPIAEGMLSGLQNTVQILRDALPQLDGLLRQTGEAFGNMARKIAETVTSAENMARIKGILETNKTFLDNFGDGLSGLTASFIILFNAAKPFIDYFGESIKKFGEWAAASLGVAEANGSLAAWMDGMLASFKDLWEITKNFGKGIGDIFSAAGPAGESLLGSIRGIAERFHAWTSDEGNMAKMRTFFEKAHTLASKVFEVLGSIFTAGGNAFVGMDLGPILHVLDTLQNVIGPAIADFFNQIQAGASDNLVKAFDNIGTALTKIADSGTFQVVAGIISGILLKLSEFAASDFGAQVLGWILPIALMGGILTSLVGPIFSILGALGVGQAIMGGVAAAAAALGISVGALVAIAAAVVGAFVLMWTNSERFRTAVMDLVTAVGTTLMDVWNRLEPKLEAIWGKIQKLAGIIGDRLAPVIEFLTPIVTRVFDFIGTYVGNLMDIFGGFIDFVSAIFTGDWSGMWTAAGAMVSGFWDLLVTIFEGIKSYISFVWDFITTIFYNAGQFLTKLWNSIWDGMSAATMAFFNWFVDSLTSFGHWITDTWNATWTWVLDIISSAWDHITAGLYDFGQNVYNVWEGIRNNINIFLTWIADGIRNFGNNIQGWWNTFWSAIWEFVKFIWNTIFNAINDFLTWIADGIRNFGNNIQIWWDQFWTGFGNVAVNTWNWIYEHTIQKVIDLYNWLVGKFTELDNWLGGIWEDFISAASSAWGRLVSIATTVWNSIYDAIIEPIKNAYFWVTGKIADIISAISTGIDTAKAKVGELIGLQASAVVISNATPGVTPGVGTGGVVIGKTKIWPSDLSYIQRILSQLTIEPITNAAFGGIFPAIAGGTLVRVGEAGRRERIDPIMANGLTARDEAMIRLLAAQFMGAQNGTPIVNVTVGNRQLEAIIDTRIVQSNSAVARRASTARAVPS